MRAPFCFSHQTIQKICLSITSEALEAHKSYPAILLRRCQYPLESVVPGHAECFRVELSGLHRIETFNHVIGYGVIGMS